MYKLLINAINVCNSSVKVLLSLQANACLNLLIAQNNFIVKLIALFFIQFHLYLILFQFSQTNVLVNITLIFIYSLTISISIQLIINSLNDVKANICSSSTPLAFKCFE